LLLIEAISGIVRAQNLDLSQGIMVNWKLENFWETEEIIFLILYAVYSVGTYFLMDTAVAKPMKLIAIFIHEFGQ
jgi:hypothetical protein